MSADTFSSDLPSTSHAAPVGHVTFPRFTGICVNMLPIILGDDSTVPDVVASYRDLIRACPVDPAEMGCVAYLSVTESITKRNTSQRRSGIHTEGTRRIDWGGAWGRAGGPRGGIYMASTVGGSCRIWNESIDDPGPLGDCEHLRSALIHRPGKIMAPGELWWLHDRTPHESLPLPKGTYRQWFRLVVGQVDAWFSDYSTANPKVPVPCRVIHGNKFGGSHS